MINESLSNEIKKLLSGDKKSSSAPIIVGKPSSILTQCGANPDQYITITKKVIDKAMRPEKRDDDGKMIGNTGHGLSESMIVDAIKELDSPIFIFKGRLPGSLLIITKIIDQKNRNIVVAIEFNKQEGFTNVNSIRSIYGRDNLDFYIGDNIESGNLLAANKIKADDMLRSIGKSYPKENTFINFN